MANRDKVSLSDDIEVTSSSPDDGRIKKKFGNITAYPHEYLIHFRNGQLHEKTSGQGGSCFKWPRDTVFIIPTSLKEIIFQANQLSADNVDVRLRGMVVYRISKPMQIYTMLNFSSRQNAEEKLARMIGDLCRSTAKWMVANMRMEDCMRKRKEDIAESLKSEVSRIVGDEEKGWGVEIVTIDIQDVYIQDAEIFSAMQAQFKSDKTRESQLIKLENEKELEAKKLEQERYLAEHRKSKELEKARIEAEIKKEQIRLSRENEEKQFALDRYRVEQNEAMSKYKLEQELARDRQKMILKAEISQQDIEAKKMAQEAEISALEKRIEVENSSNETSMERLFIETALPSIANALAKSMSNTKVNIYQQDAKGGSPFKFMLTELLDIMQERISSMQEKKTK
ncbi:MAG: hypothetical protein HQK76_11515 [Desulfobacterales bacterium]|nr:hypothetical protein [Desulfobacterales bacterium]